MRPRAVVAVLWMFVGYARERLRQMWRRPPGTPRSAGNGRATHFLDGGGYDRGETSAKATATAAASIVGSVGLVGLVEQYGIGGILYATFLEVIGGIQSFGGTITAPFVAFGNGLADLVSAVIPVRIVNAAADFTAFSITRGEWAIFGPFTFAVGVGATLAGLWVFTEIVRRADLSVFSALLDRQGRN